MKKTRYIALALALTAAVALPGAALAKGKPAPSKAASMFDGKTTSMFDGKIASMFDGRNGN
jgi:hypothetical protein